MKNKYIIEDNINFFLELKKPKEDFKSEDFSNNEIEKEEEKREITKNNYCLITNDILNKDSIRLDCGHFFNYKPLFYELVHQIIYVNEFTFFLIPKKMCPYCRKIIDSSFLLPFKENIINIKIYGINTNDKKYKIKIKLNEIKLNEIKKCNNVECYHLATHKLNHIYYCSQDCDTNIKLNIKKCNDKKEEKKNICSAYIKNGINKNKKCCFKTINQSLFCGFHKNYKTEENQTENQTENINKT